MKLGFLAIGRRNVGVGSVEPGEEKRGRRDLSAHTHESILMQDAKQ